MAEQQEEQLLSYDEIINQVPEERPRLTYDQVLNKIPVSQPAGFEQSAPPKDYNPVQRWWMDMFGQTDEQAKAQASGIIAVSELTGQSPTEFAIDQDLLKDVYEEPTLGEAVKARAEFVANRFNTSRDSMNAAQQWAVAFKNQDKESLLEATLKFQDANARKLEDPRIGQTEQWVFRSASELAGQLFSFMEDGAEEFVFGFGLGGVVTGNPVAAAGGGAVALGLGATMGMFESMLGVQALDKIEAGMDPRFAFYSSIPTAAALALSERLQLSTLLRHVPGLKQTVAVGIAEGAKKVEHWTLSRVGLEAMKTGFAGTAQEAAQTVMEQFDIEVSKAVSNRLLGTDITQATLEEVVNEVKAVAKEVLPGMILLGGAGSLTGYSAQKMNREADKRLLVEDIKKAVEEPGIPAVETTLRDKQGAEVEVGETIPVDEDTRVVDEEGAEQPTLPLTPTEVAEQETRQKEPIISDEEFDNLVLTPEEDLDAAVDEVLTKATQTGDRYGDFVQNIREALGKKQAKIIERLIEARAKATNRTAEQFAEDHQLRFSAERDESGIWNASVEFIQDGETIVRAFQNATMKDVVHEVSHVFRKDLNAAELSAAEQAFDVKDGNWDRAAEERFADGFVQYMMDGTVANQSLKKVFDKFKQWLGRLYETVTRTGIEVSPEMRSLFDAMLAESVNADNQHRMAQARQATHTLFSEDKKKKRKRKTQAERQAERLQQIVDDKQALHDALKSKVITARKAAALGQRIGYNKAKAESYGVIQRAATRARRQKERSRWRKKIEKLIKDQKTFLKGGKRTGKFSADFQPIADAFIRIFSMPVAEAKALDQSWAREDIPGAFDTTDLDALERWLVRVRANSQQLSPEGLKQLHEDLVKLFEEQQRLRHAEIAPIMQRVQEIRQSILESLRNLRERKGMDPELRGAYADEVKGKMKSFIDKAAYNVIYDFHGLMELLDMGLKDAFGEGVVAQFGKTREAENRSNTGRRTMNTRLFLDAAEIYGLKDEDGNPDLKAVENKFAQEEREERRIIAEFEILDKKGNPTGKRHRLRLNRAEVRKLWMELQDEEIRKQYEALGLTPAMQQNIRAEFMDKEDVDFANAQFKIYQEYYDRINEVYRRHHRVDLPKVEFYSPIIRDLDRMTEEGPAGDILNDHRHSIKYVTAGGRPLMQRVSSDSLLKPQSDINAINHYIRQMEHYIAFKDLTAMWNQVFGESPEVRAAIKDTYGEEMLKAIDTLRTNIARNGSIASERFDFLQSTMRTIRGNLARGMVGMKVMSIPKQITSFLAFSEDVSMGEFFNEIQKFLMNPKKHIEEMRQWSEFVQNRTDTLDRDIAMLTNTSEFNDIIGKKLGPSFNRVTMMFVKAGDITAIYAGGWARYQILRRQGMSHEEAVANVEELAVNTQQSSELAHLTVAQQGGEFMKLMTMFSTAQRQYFQRAVLAHLALKNQRMSREEYTKRMLMYLIALPVLFQAVAQGGFSDEDDVRAAMRAVAVSPMQAIPFASQTGGFLLTYLVEGHTYGRGAGNMAVFSPVERFVRGTKQLKKFDINDISMSDILQAVRDLAAPGEYLGVPVGGIGSMAVGIADLMEGEGIKGGLEVLGMSPYTAKKRTEK